MFAALAGSLLFSVGIAIANIAVRELALSSTGRESQFAFYAADSGAECALYWDIQEKRFPSVPDSAAPIICNTASVALSVAAISGGARTSFTLPLRDTACALVSVSKTSSTLIESRGRNDCGAGDNPARVERAIRVRY
ncbi:MAG: hypothetical protein HYS57_01250 [Parcubacteria group bacterium]|nr:hypothetical protein [Parcubacteria group bacterium]